MDTRDSANDVAVVGLSCRVPGARNTAEYWRNLCAGVESISFFSDGELRAAGASSDLLRDPSYVRAHGAMLDAYAFDAAFFGVSQSEASVMDPQQRVFLECAWTALEDAGCDPRRFAGAIGVFAGSGNNVHHARVAAHPELLSSVGSEVVQLANNRDFLTTRVSYRLGLRGPSVVLQTACSTSLVAIHMACQSLLNRECDLALAGGVTIALDQTAGYRYQEGGIRSRDGHCRAFDAAATGCVPGSGAGVVVLARMEDALRDGSPIHAVVKGWAINNDGAEKIGFAAPSVKGQATVIAEALAMAALDPSAVSYVETHGTGTALGDPIEIAALKEVFGTRPRRRCALGAVKTNIGHLDTAAGVAGFIKTVLALEHRMLPPTLHFQTPNPETRLDDSPFYVSTTLCPWESKGMPRRAGVSSFGIGGTNAHVVLEEAPELPAPPPDDGAQLVVLSAKSEAALERTRRNLAEHFSEHPDTLLADAAHTLQDGRAAHPHRWAVVASGVEEARAALAATGGRTPMTRRAADRPPSMAFLFPGQGSQYAGMARELYRRESIFQREIDRCAEALTASLGVDLRRVLFPRGGGEAEADALLQQTRYTQPSLFTVEYALAMMWMSWGVRPEALLGHSIGEYAAACVAGVFSLEGALRLVEARGRLMQGLPAGAMLAVGLSEEEVRPLLFPGSSLAAVNGEASCVVSGSMSDIERTETVLRERGVAARRLTASHAFHSAAMDPILEAFAFEVSKVRAAAPCVPFVSNVTGDWITASQATDPGYWVRHLRETVRFADGARRLVQKPGCVLLEVGPGDALGTLVRRCLPGDSRHVIVRSLPQAHQPDASDVTVLDALGALWTAGVDIQWSSVRRERRRRRISLPTYPFERTEYRVPRPLHAASLDARRLPREAMPMPAATESIGVETRTGRIAARLAHLFARLLGTAAGELDASGTFLELGADSLLLMQASRAIESEFGVRVPFRRLLEGLTTVKDLSEHLDRELPPDAPAAAAQPAMPAPSATQVPSPVQATPPAESASGLHAIVAQQLAIMQTQLELLRGAHATRAEQPTVAAVPEKVTSHGPHVPIRQTIGLGGGYTERQARHFEELVRRHTSRTRRSKEYAQENRRALADNRAAAGFRMATKELVYPVVGERSQGSRIWDVDGNEYIDFTMGFGVHFFGHRPPWIVQAVEEQLRRGFHLGPQSDLAGPAARLFCELTGMERATFSNTGSEAVMTAIRIARAATGRDRIVIFQGSYHGCFDGVLARGGHGHTGEPVSHPLAPGTPQRMVDDVVVLPYGTDEALTWLKANAASLAAVLVEPVQTRNPELHPREFLREVRALTASAGAVLIFDEMITGFRLGLRGAQGYYGIDADLATYGKVIGGGFPVGVIAGRGQLMDRIDGGVWSFGDDSFPAADQTFFAGTFCKHPLAMAATYAVLRHLEERGPALYDELNARTARLVAALQRVMSDEQGPIRVVSCASRFNLRVDQRDSHANLLFYHLLERGMYIWEGRGCFLSTAHTDEDCDRLVEAARASIHALREGGFLQERSEAGGETPSGPTRSFSLTPAQRQIWVHAQLGDDASRAYNEQLVFGLRGHLNVAALRAALDDVMQHHEALRTVFEPSGETRRVLPAMPAILRTTGETAAADRNLEDLSQLLHEAAGEIFDLSSGPLLRAHVHRRGPEYQVVQIVFHHLAMDALGSRIFLLDLERAYAARRDGDVPRLAPAMQFSEYAARLQAHAERLAGEESTWLSRFAGAAPLLLPTDRPRSQVPTNPAGTATRTIPPSLASKLKATGRAEGRTLLMTLLGALLATLHRFADQDDILVGIPSAGRPFPGADSLVGHCVDILPIRSRIGPATCLRSFLDEVRGSLLGAYEHEVFALGLLTQKLPVPRGPGVSPLVSVVLNVEPGRGARGEGTRRFADLEIEAAPAPTLFAKSDVGLDAMEVGDEIHVTCVFNADLFEPATIARLLGHLERVLGQIATGIDVPLSALAPLDAAERRTIVEDWNRTDAAYPADRCLHQLFEAQAERTPGAVAAVCEDQPLRYGELNRRANQLAHHLRRLGVRPEVRVGLCLERSFDLLVAILGVLKAGGAYVPLDPEYPAERLACMLADSGGPVVVTHERARHVIPDAAAHVLSLDADSTGIAAESTEDPECGVTPANLAYVIYTSGSSGRPKGAMNAHGAVVNSIAWMQAACSLGPDDVVLQKTPYSFDASVCEMFWPLTRGASLVVARPDGHRDPAYLEAMIERHGVTAVDFVPSMLQAFVEIADPARCASLELVTCGGEALSPTLAARVHARFPSVSLVNIYGPTETAIGVSYWACERNTSAEAIPIGRPVSNTQFYVLDRMQRPVAVGVPGELYVGGVQVGRGYLNRPGLTAERFVPDPFSPDAGRRLYRTGDRVRWRADGTLEFLGRLDGQVKIRGVRIEVGEIEAALRQHPSVRDCAVLAREDVRGEPRLVAYVASEADAESLRVHLRRMLPEYMTPAAIVRLDRLPLLLNGKLDSRALPAPDYGAASGAYVAPRTSAERALAEIWQEVLRIERVGVGSNFFGLGGDSILAIQVASRARRAGLALSPRHIFEHPTIAELASAMDAVPEGRSTQPGPVSGRVRPRADAPGYRPSDFPLAELSQRELEAVLGNRRGIEDLYPLSPMQEGMLFHALESQAYQVQTAERLEGPLDVALFRRAWDAVIGRHAVLRTAFVWKGLRRPLQRVEATVTVPWVVEDWRDRSDEVQAAALERYLADDRRRGFVLDEAPLLRGALFRAADEAHWFVWTQHHLLTDGWSTARIVGDVYRLYDAWAAGDVLELPRVLPYRNYIAWLQQQDQAAAEQYWRGVLDGITAPTALGVDRPARSGIDARYAQQRLRLSAAQAERLEAAARRWQVTLNTVVEGAWGLLLSRYSGEPEVVFGHTVAGRPANLDGVEEMTGLFINTLPVRLAAPGAARVGAWLDAFQRAQAVARDYEYAPLVQIQGWSAVPRGTPLFESHFIYENYPVERSAEEATRGRLRVTRTRGTGWTTYPLSLLVYPGRGELSLALNYDERRFEAETATRMLRHMDRLLERMATGADVRLSELELLDSAERTQVVEAWNQTAAAFPADRCVHELFEAQAAATPTAVAVSCGDDTLTYGELNARANQLAHHLQRLGVGPDVRVGICLERSPDLVVSLLAVLKAGGCYVPLEPAYPAERLAFMLVDASVMVVLTQERLRGVLPGRDDAAVVSIDGARRQIAGERVDNPDRGPEGLGGPQSLAYVVYTSGSTGTPKGVAVPHSAVVRLVRNTDYVTLTPADRIAQASTVAFDAATFEVWGALLNGAALVLLSQDAAVTPALLAAEIDARAITTLFLTTALFNAIAGERPAAFRPLRWLLFGGEAVDPGAVRNVLAAGPPEHLLHVYGPTENTTFSTWHEVDEVPADAHTVPIGRPVSNSTALVLDESLQPVPVGVPGELCLGGAGLARGYLGRPELTAERFVPDAFGGEPGGRVYRTGDRVRWRAGGALEFLERLDAQAKIRGFRIEPGEVEAVAATHPEVREVRVIVREDTPGEKRLLAYVVGTAAAENLRSHLRLTLPDYMVPTAFVRLEALPLTPNGKLDVRALPPPEYGEAACAYVGARTPVEEALSGIWAEVLDRERVSVTDDFFALGGHSLLVMRLTARVEAAFGVRLPIRTVFDAPTLAAMAAEIERRIYADVAAMPEAAAEQFAELDSPRVRGA